MSRKQEVYECKLCENVVQIIHSGDGELVCCGQPMEMSVPNAAIVPQRESQLLCKDKLA